MKRRKAQKTDYRRRLRLLKSRKTRLVVRRNHSNIHVQFINYEVKGDKVVLEEMSKNLKKYGWKGHGGNLPSAYLLGILAGKKAMQKGVHSCVVDIGLHAANNSVLYAAAKGVSDAGISVPLGAEIDAKRLNGTHIAEYAKVLKKDAARYKKQFSSYIKAGLEPENLVQHFNETKANIVKNFPEKKKVEA